ncbi:hypothetical protein QZH41_013687 [Actinostola sp. cb2023]|nr:hypothetical protein QZH41_013687 [Actinostola sp. cb2023]
MEALGDSGLSVSSQYSTQRQSKETLPIIERHSSRSVVLQNVFFAFLIVVGTTGQNITLPLWIDSGRKDGNKTLNNCKTNSNDTQSSRFQPFMDDLFVSVFTSFIFMILFGVSLVIKNLDVLLTAGRHFDRRISHKLTVLTGFLAAVVGVLIVYSSSGKRTAPYLQAILFNITIPTTLILSFMVLYSEKITPTKRKLICALATVLSLLVCLLPSIIPEIDPKHRKNKEQGGAKGLAGILWPLCFMLGFTVAATNSIVQEKLLQYQHASSTKQVDMLYILFLTELFQFLFILALFWVDALPFFGNVDSINKVFVNFYFGLRCFFGYAGCSFYPALYGTLYILSFIGYFVGSACLLRYSEGATYVAIVSLNRFAVYMFIVIFIWTSGHLNSLRISLLDTFQRTAVFSLAS